MKLSAAGVRKAPEPTDLGFTDMLTEQGTPKRAATTAATVVALLDAGAPDGITEGMAAQMAMKKARRGDNKAAERTQAAWGRGSGGNSRLRSRAMLQQARPKSMPR
ncbi:hypothetical protein FOA52_009405 [Chlamydomonas sp. UWO 241]|nr:hypothetical protein FOA52_009405 [Chlamydomonas sp. UWO 241]